jgi:hypothetical protein
MRKITLAIGLITFTFSSIFAQDDSREKLHIGVKGGLNFASLIQDDYPDYEVDHKIGYVAGAFLAIPLNKFIGLQPEVLISQKGFESKGTFLLSNYTFSRTTTYLDIPLQIQLKPMEQLAIVGGVQYSYLLSKKDEVSGPNSSVVDEVKYDNDDVTKNLLGAVVGLDITLNHFLIFGRYNLDLRKNNGDGTTTIPKYKNQVFQIGVGLRL